MGILKTKPYKILNGDMFFWLWKEDFPRAVSYHNHILVMLDQDKSVGDTWRNANFDIDFSILKKKTYLAPLLGILLI